MNRKNRDNGELEPFIAEQQTVVNENVEATSESSNENEIEIIRSKQFSLKPMDSEEAVLQMDLLGHDFYILQIVKQMVQVLCIDVKMVNMV